MTSNFGRGQAKKSVGSCQFNFGFGAVTQKYAFAKSRCFCSGDKAGCLDALQFFSPLLVAVCSRPFKLRGARRFFQLQCTCLNA